MASKTMMNYYSPAVFLTLFSWLVFAVSLAISPAQKKKWLKMAGMANGIVVIALLATHIGNIYSQSVAAKTMLTSIALWTTLIGSLTPILFCIHFLIERREVSSANENVSAQNAPTIMLSITVLLILFSTLVYGFKITSDSYYHVYWGKRNLERTQQLAKLCEAHTFISSKGDTLLYRLLKPLNYDTTKKYPLVVSLPYGGGSTDKIIQIEGAAAAELLSTDSNRQKYPAFLFIPLRPSNASWGGIAGYTAIDSSVYEAITSLDQQYGIDVKRRYVTGISMGGYGTWHFIGTRPDLFAAAIPVCGAGDPALVRKMINVHIWAFHGRHDRNVPVSGSRDMIEAFKRTGGNPKYTEFPTKAHNIWDEVMSTPGLLDWLFAQHQP
jgi:predicted peptidase